MRLSKNRAVFRAELAASLCAAILSVCVLVSGSAVGQVDGQARLPRDSNGFLENTDTFAIAYLLSSVSFDSCGDAAHGELLRRSLVQRLMACPFSPKAKAAFMDSAGPALLKLKEGNARNPERNAKNCARIQANPKYAEDDRGVGSLRQGSNEAAEIVADGLRHTAGLSVAP